jgi:hypothetical protein
VIFRRRSRKELAERVLEAQAEAELSRKLLKEARESVIIPLRKAAEHNQFAEMIRLSLIEGRSGGRVK